MKFLGLLLVGVFGGGFCLGADVVVKVESLKRVAFGSCYKPAKGGKVAKIWDSIVGVKPDLFLMLGDNVYADTSNLGKMRGAYEKLNADVGYRKLKAVCAVKAIWDDHDYGKNDAGAEFEAKEGAKVEFMRAFGVGETHPMRQRGGVYHSVMYVDGAGKRVQILMLDTRFFRSALKREGKGRRMVYLPNVDEGATILGSEQWAWLEKELAEPADVRIIGSSVQVVSEEHRYEKWANFPGDRKRLMAMLKKAGNVVVLSGDRHMGEISREDGILDVTSSGLTNAGGGYGDKNRHRVGRRVGVRNFGLVTIDWSGERVKVEVGLMDAKGVVKERVEL